MIELMVEANNNLMSMPISIQFWMHWRGFIFFSSIIFLKNHKPARYALAAMLITIPVSLVVYYFLRKINLLGIAHLFTWLPLLIYFLKYEIKFSKINFKSPYEIWTLLLCSTIIISLLFDIRDIFLVFNGQK